MRFKFGQKLIDIVRNKKHKKLHLLEQDKSLTNPSKFPIILTDNEKNFLLNQLKNTTSYLEFGSGGSTFLAVQLPNINNIVSVESDNKWLDFLREWLVIRTAEKKRLKFKYINIGEVGDYGVPTNINMQHLYPNYPKQVFEEDIINNYEFVFIDGRFRVACALQTILNCKLNTKIIMHDFNNRTKYHIILKYLNIIDTMDTMALFSIKENINKDELLEDYEKYKIIYD